MYKPSKRIVIAVLALGLAGFAFGVWVLLNPASIFVQPWRAVRAEAPVKGVLLGPYPVEEDFADLKKRGVTTIISLLEPNVPYEKVLLERERALAERHGMTVKNFPMGSILGQKFGENYSKNSKAAAEAALSADGVAYIHCYLGLHRAMADHGIAVETTGVGDRYVLERMTEGSFSLGGEQSGHVIMSRYATTGDGVLTGLHLVAEMARTGKTLAELASVMTVFPQVLVNVRGVERTRATDPDVVAAVEVASKALGDSGRVLLRPSGTELMVRVMVEAASEADARRIADELADVVRG